MIQSSVMVPECKKQPIFLLGLPRCRTAWVSMCLSSIGVNCAHEGMRDHGTFEKYAEELEGRLSLGMAGDADPGLCHFVKELFQRWPKARFVVLSRDDDKGAALAHAAPSDASPQIWGNIVDSFKSSIDCLRFLGADFSLQDIDIFEEKKTMLDFFESLTGVRQSEIWAKRMQRLKVTSIIDVSECFLKAVEAPKIKIPDMCFDTDGLSVREFQFSDYVEVSRWWRSHTGVSLAFGSLPPLGVVVELRGVPCAAVWVYEIYGVPIAELTFPVTDPNLPPKDASRALSCAAHAAMSMAGSGFDPRVIFKTFKVVCPKGKVKYMKRLGFAEYLTDRQPMILTL